MQCVLTPGDKWMPATTEAIAMATLEQVRKLFPSAENLQVGQGDICIVFFIEVQ